MFNSEKLLTHKRHTLEMSKSALMADPCQNHINKLRTELAANANKLNREISLKQKNDKRELKTIQKKHIFKNPETIYTNKINEFTMLKDKIESKSSEILLINAHELDKIKNNSAIKNLQKIYQKRRDELNKTIEKIVSKSNEIIHANDYRLKSVKARPALTNHLDDYMNDNYNQLNNVKSNLEKNFSSKIYENKRELDFALNNKVFKNPEVLYESKKDELNRIKTSKIIENPHMIFKEKKKEVEIQEEKLDKINQVLMLKKIAEEHNNKLRRENGHEEKRKDSDRKGFNRVKWLYMSNRSFYEPSGTYRN